MTHIHDLTDEQLRRVIAERLGITVVGVSMDDDNYGLGLYDWTFTRGGDYLAGVFADTEDEAWLRAWEPSPDCEHTPLPDWPGDERAALRACMDVARERDMVLRMYHVFSADGEFMIAAELYEDEERSEEYPAYAPTLARALAELLAAALEPQP